MTRSARSPSSSMRAGWSSPTRPASPSAGDDAGRPTRDGASDRRSRGAYAGRGRPSERATSSMRPLRVVEVVRPGRAVPGRDLGRAGQDEAEPPPLVGAFAVVAARRSPCRSRRSRRPARPWRRFVAATSSRLPEQPLAHDRVLARQRVRDRDGRPPAAPSPATTGSSTAGKRSTMAGETSAERHGLRQSRARRGPRGRRRAARSGDGRYGGIGVSGRMSGIELVAADPGDLLGDVRLDGEVAAPGRDGRHEDVRLRGVHLERLRAAGNDDARAGGRRLGRDADARQHGALLVGGYVDAQQAVDPRRSERRRAPAAAPSGSCRSRPSRRCRRPTPR